MTVTPIVLQARMIQSCITYWQAMFVMQKQWFDAFGAPVARPAETRPAPEADLCSIPLSITSGRKVAQA